MTNVVPFARRLRVCPTCGHVEEQEPEPGSGRRWLRHRLEIMAIRLVVFAAIVFAFGYMAFGLVLIFSIPYGGVGWAIAVGLVLLVMLRLLRLAVAVAFRLPSAVFEHHHYGERR